MRFLALFGKVFWQTALSSLQLSKDNFSGASWPGLERPLLRVTKKMQEKELTVFISIMSFHVHIQDKNSKPFQMS